MQHFEMLICALCSAPQVWWRPEAPSTETTANDKSSYLARCNFAPSMYIEMHMRQRAVPHGELGKAWHTFATIHTNSTESHRSVTRFCRQLPHGMRSSTIGLPSAHALYHTQVATGTARSIPFHSRLSTTPKTGWHALLHSSRLAHAMAKCQQL